MSRCPFTVLAEMLGKRDPTGEVCGSMKAIRRLALAE
jgi:hypothetical protein